MTRVERIPALAPYVENPVLSKVEVLSKWNILQKTGMQPAKLVSLKWSLSKVEVTSKGLGINIFPSGSYA